MLTCVVGNVWVRGGGAEYHLKTMHTATNTPVVVGAAACLKCAHRSIYSGEYILDFALESKFDLFVEIHPCQTRVFDLFSETLLCLNYEINGVLLYHGRCHFCRWVHIWSTTCRVISLIVLPSSDCQIYD